MTDDHRLEIRNAGYRRAIEIVKDAPMERLDGPFEDASMEARDGRLLQLVSLQIVYDRSIVLPLALASARSRRTHRAQYRNHNARSILLSITTRRPYRLHKGKIAEINL